MGDHYVTRGYLKAWERDGRLWAHDRASQMSFQTQRKSIAQQTGFYSSELEQRLANEIDGPGIEALRLFADGARLTPEQRRTAAKYIFVQRKRVPAAKVRFFQDLPGVVQELQTEYESAIRLGESQDDAFKARAPEIRAQLQAFFSGQTLEQQTAIWHEVIPDETGPDVISALMSFSWILVDAPADSLMTCDNPVYFHTHEGLVAPNSEMTLTLSPCAALWATREPLKDGSRIRASKSFVRELNRRVAHNSTRWVVSSMNHSWIQPFLRKGDWALNRVRGPKR